jgi:haloacetate dehalogenase
MTWFDGFEQRRFDVNGVAINARIGGAADAPPLLMLHGFPQTHAIWHRVVRALHGRFRFVLPDLRGYGDSAKPAGESDHANYSKRTMARDMAELMTQLGHERFGVVGHDRGGRVAHRLALDHAQRVTRLAVLDIAPTLDMYAATDMAFATAYYHWFHLIQPAPLPERMIGGDPKFCLHWGLGGWGPKGTAYIEPEALADYERCFCTPEAIHAACEDYRASASIDLEHDRALRAAGEKVRCDMLVLWGERGVVHRLFHPLSLWQAQCAAHVSGEVMAAGHFIPEELPAQTAAHVERFFG